MKETDCSRLKCDDIANLVRNATGNVAILAKREGETVHATFIKDRQDVDVGFCLTKLGQDVVVRGISSTSPCYGSLMRGHKIKSIEVWKLLDLSKMLLRRSRFMPKIQL